jgi:hypothetical protein
MQPQEPKTPVTPENNNAPATPPAEPTQPTAPSEPVTPTTPVEAPIAAPASTATPPTPAKSKPPTKLIAIILGAVLLIAAGVSAYFLLFSGIKLSTYNSDKFSVQYPEGYQQKAEDSGVTFNEPGDEATASSVFAYYSEFPEEIEQEQVDIFKSAFKEQVESNFGGVTGSDIELTGTKAEDVTYKGSNALQITGNAKRQGADFGKMKLIVVIDTKKLYMVGVGAHTSDAGVASATDKIINSFTVK